MADPTAPAIDEQTGAPSGQQGDSAHQRDQHVTHQPPGTGTGDEHGAGLAAQVAQLATQIATLTARVDSLIGQVDDLTREVVERRVNPEKAPTDAMPSAPTNTQPQTPPSDPASPTVPTLDHSASADAKIALFRGLFVGRDDVYAERWENERRGTSGWRPVHDGPPDTPKQKRRYLPLTDEVVRSHLEGRRTIGLYPLRPDNRCRLLACDLDHASWRDDARAYLEAADAIGVPVLTELSRSGDGAHLWTFFSEPVFAGDARMLGTALLRAAMARRATLDLSSYDRLFPAQDRLKADGFGNLIALPLQGRCRRERATTVFLDPVTLEPEPDQFAVLSAAGRLDHRQLRALLDELGEVVVGPSAPLVRPAARITKHADASADATTDAPADAATDAATDAADPSEPLPPAAPTLPPTITARMANMLAIPTAALTTSLAASLRHLASVRNPKFYANERMRISNHDTPRFVACYLDQDGELHLPRGLHAEAAALVEAAGSMLHIVDERPDAAHIDLAFHGQLRPDQARAAEAMLAEELGVLVAPPGSGKTVIACALIAEWRTPTLVIVDRSQLLEQWRARVHTHLDVAAGQIGGGKIRPGGIVDVAMVQTLAANPQAAAQLEGYGTVVLDECHHTAARTVEAVVRALTARRFLGLTATPTRPDGLQEIMVMQCGPVRHRLEPPASDIRRIVHEHDTDLRIDADTQGLNQGQIHALLHEALAADEQRNTQVARDVSAAADAGRSCLVLTSRTEHVEVLAELLRADGHDPLTLYGSMTPRQRRSAHEALDGPGPHLLVATDRYLGEGFDCPALDTLFLAAPISAPQRIVQYAGRIVREHPGKTTAEVHDYLDVHVPVFARWRRKRRPGFTSLGFVPAESVPSSEVVPDTARPAGAPARSRSSAPHGQPPAAAAAAPAAAPSTAPAATPGDPTPQQIRQWARSRGYRVADRGRISAEIRAAYEAVHR